MSNTQKIPAGVKTLLWSILGIVALVFAVQGGEYSTVDLLRQRHQLRELRVQVDSMQHMVDSLSQYRDRVLHDPALQERIGREEFGWVRGDKEVLYRFAEPDSSGN